MRWLLNRNTATKLIIAFTLLLSLAIVIGAVGLNQAARIRGNAVMIGQSALPRVRLLGEMRSLAWRRRALGLERIDLGRDPAAVRRVSQSIDSIQSALNADLEELGRGVSGTEERRIYESGVQAWQDYLAEGRRAAELVAAGKIDEARALGVGSATSKMEEADAAFQRVVETNAASVNELLKASAQQYASARGLIIGVLLGALAIGIVLALVISRAMSRQLTKAVTAIDSLAAGDLTARAQVDSADEIGRAATALNGAMDAIQGALRDVRDSADTTLSSAQQLQAASEEISAGAQEQATSLEETAASLEEMTASVRQNSDHAQQADQLAISARDLAERGGKVVLEAVDAMGQINEASRQIADIISTIDEIAFQTNILALNAAVEAARAGQQGRGFAVVAGEVRSLAQRSAAAAKEIKALIQNSTQKVEAGRELVHRSGESLQEIVSAVKRVSDIVGDMAAASREQASGIEQVNRAITQMDSVTQSNASQTEELASTAEALASQAEQLQGLVGRFTVDEEHRPGTRRQAPRAAAPARFHDGGRTAAAAGRVRPLQHHALAFHPSPSRAQAPQAGDSAHALVAPAPAPAPAPEEPALQPAGANGDVAAARTEPLPGLDEFQEY